MYKGGVKGGGSISHIAAIFKSISQKSGVGRKKEGKKEEKGKKEKEKERKRGKREGKREEKKGKIKKNIYLFCDIAF